MQKRVRASREIASCNRSKVELQEFNPIHTARGTSLSLYTVNPRKGFRDTPNTSAKLVARKTFAI